MFFFSMTTVFLIALDYLTKHLAWQYLTFREPVVIIPDILRLVYLKNTGAAFGLLKGQQFFLAIIAALVLLYIVYYVKRELCINRTQYTSLIFIFAGTAGNFINRVFAGGVIDFFDLYGKWPIFNLADIFINIGVFLLIVSIFKYKKPRSKKQ